MSGRVWSLLPLAMAAMSAAGCSSFRPASIALPFEPPGDPSIRLTYRVESKPASAPVAATSVRGCSITQQPLSASDAAGQSYCVLELHSPHPANRPGYALAGLLIYERNDASRGLTSWSWFKWLKPDWTRLDVEEDRHEAWTLDVPVGDVERIVRQLQASGSHASDKRHEGPAELTLDAADELISKTWTRVPALDQLMRRVQQQGHLVSFRSTAESPGSAQNPPSARSAASATAGTRPNIRQTACLDGADRNVTRIPAVR